MFSALARRSRDVGKARLQYPRFPAIRIRETSNFCSNEEVQNAAAKGAERTSRLRSIEAEGTSIQATATLTSPTDPDRRIGEQQSGRNEETCSAGEEEDGPGDC